MRRFLLLAGILAATACAGGAALLAAEQPSGDTKEITPMKAEALSFLDNYQKELAALEIEVTLAEWKSATTGKQEDFDAAALATLALNEYHSNADAYRLLVKLTANQELRKDLSPLTARALDLALLAYRRNQLPLELLKKMVDRATEIRRLFNTYRAELDGKKLSNNDLLEMLAEEKDSARRQAIWEALKQVGAVVSPKLIELAEVRNEAAATLGFDNFWEMSIRLQEIDPRELLTIFDELEQLTGEPFTEMKGEMDRELAMRFGVVSEAVMPWHYDNPFFQAAPPSDEVDLDEFYQDKPKEEIVEIAERFFNEIGLPIDTVLARSDLYERPGKDQHAFCISIDRSGDVRTLLNVKPTQEWMDTMLHEQGHAVYDLGIDPALPYNVREPAHPFTTEGVAMLFGALAKSPGWMVEYAGADTDRVDAVAEALRQQRRREQLIFARWTLVMLHFEKALYENPRQDLDTLWWDYKERFQLLHRPGGRDEPDWAAKPHFTIAPVYYHSYMLGELFASQLRASLGRLADHEGPTSSLSFSGRKDFGRFLTEKVFQPGSRWPWPEFVRQATGEPLSAKYFAAEVK